MPATRSRQRAVHSLANGRRYGIGQLELASLQSLRVEATSSHAPGRLRFSTVTGDLRRLHRTPDYAGALFRVASQFNLLEMTSPEITPEQGVTRYQHDHTQGTACAIAAGAATIDRNYFVPLEDGVSQTARRQLNGLAEIGVALSEATGVAVDRLWSMRNGYALCSRERLAMIAAWLRGAGAKACDTMRSQFRIGRHCDVEVTDGDNERGPVATQAFCSALPVA